MSKKSNIILSIIIVSFIVSVCSIGVNQNNPSTQIKKQDDDIITELSVPETSGYTVTQKWKWTYPWGAPAPDALQVEISKDGNYIVARWRNNPNATLFKKDSNATVWIYEGTGNIVDVAISGDGKYIVLSNGSHVICLDNSMETPKTALWAYDCGDTCDFVDISYNGDYISTDNTTHVILLDKNGQVKWVYDTVQNQYDLAISADGRHVIICDDNPFVTVLNTTDYDQGIPMWTYSPPPPGLPNKVAISDDGNYAVVSDDQKNVYLFNTTDYDQGIPMWNYSDPRTIVDLGISSDGKNIIVTGGFDLRYFNNSFSGGQKLPMWTYPIPGKDAFTSADINADGTYIVCGASGPSAYLLNNSLTPKTAEWDALGDINDVAISGWGNYFIVADIFSTIYLFHHERPPAQPYISSDDDDDDDDEEAAIPFGNYYLLFAIIGIVALILIHKRKVIVSRNK